MGGWMDGWMDIDRWMDIDGWMDGSIMDPSIHPDGWMDP